MRIMVASSIISANFAYLDREIRRVEQAGADMLHIDVMDGHFVPNLTIGPLVVKDIRKITRLPLDVHLMIEQPERFVDSFIKAGSNIITLHIETISNSKLKTQNSKLKTKGVKLGISLNPATPLQRIKKVLDLVDLVLIMSVNPGFSGQEFIPNILPKIRRLRSIFDGDIAVDGGINIKTARQVVECGANVLAAGSYIFNSKNYREAIRRLKNVGTNQ